MQSFRKNLTTIIIIAVTVILAGIALFTALRLYQLRQTSVAPNVPSSQPGAFTTITCNTPPTIDTNNFTLGPGTTLSGTQINMQVPLNSTGQGTAFTTSNLVTGDFQVDSHFVNFNTTPTTAAENAARITISTTNKIVEQDGTQKYALVGFTSNSTSTTAHDVRLSYSNGPQYTVVNSLTNVTTQNTDITLRLIRSSNTLSAYIKVGSGNFQLIGTSTAPEIANSNTPVYIATDIYSNQSSGPSTATVDKFSISCLNPVQQCTAVSFTITAPTATPTTTATATATAVPQCGTTCTTNSDCPSSMICSAGVCRNPSCTTSTNCICATSTATPVPTVTATATAVPQCGTTCTSNANCPGSMICSSGVCRNLSCTTSTSCVCATATATATTVAVVTTPPATAAPSLPNAGVSTPTIVAIVTAILLIMGALILVF